jgi:hypothetical protein
VSQRKWWIAAVLALLVPVGAGAGVLIWRHKHPSRPPVAAVTPVLDQAIAGVVAAIGDTAAVTVSGLVPTTACSGGRIYTRTADLYMDPSSEDSVIAAIVASLPASERPRGPQLGSALIDVSLANGTTLQVGHIDAGWLAATARSGCRSAGPSAVAPSAMATPAPTDGTLTGLLTALGTAPAAWRSTTVECTGSGGQIVTVSASSAPTSLDNIRVRLAKLVPAGITAFTSPSDRIAWRQGSISTVIEAADDGTHLTAQRTTVCAA